MSERQANSVKSGAGARPYVLFLPCYRDQRMLEGVCKYAYEANWVLDTLPFHTQNLPHAWEGDGILCMLQIPCGRQPLNDFVVEHTHLPIVDLSNNAPDIELPRVLQDNVGMGRLGAEHLLSRGCRRLGFVMHTRSAFHERRFEGFRDAAAAVGVEVALIGAPDDYMRAGRGAVWLTKHLLGSDGPFGIMAAADYLSQWVIRACDEARLSIPEDVALMGVDNCREICELSSVAITSVDNNAFQHAYQGAKLLGALMAGEPAPAQPIVVPGGALHVRASTDIRATQHPHVAAALKVIDENFTDTEFTPQHVAARVPMSARRLHDAFQKFVGRSIYQEIVQRRLQHALRLVQSTDSKLWDIAESSGFSSPELMSRLFSRTLGHPPSHFRNRAQRASAPS